jgi:triacylglycerol esterase/lipase EstA (alpha/beta hydrolase family)
MRQRLTQIVCAIAPIIAALVMPVPGYAAGGYNDFTCRPSRIHPLPVVMVHGAGIAGVDMAAASWSYIAPALRRNGYCGFALDYGKYGGIWGRDTVQHDAAQLKAYVTRVMSATHSNRVALIAHSAGGVVARYYLRFAGGASNVDDLVSIASPAHPTTLKHSCPLLCTQLNGSTIYRQLNKGGELMPDVDYTAIESQFDGSIVPYTASFLSGAPGQLTNVLIQRRCPQDHSTHISLLFDPVVLQWIEDALAHTGPANANFRPQC